MSSLKDILRSFSVPPTTLGRQGTVNRTAFDRELSRLLRHLRMMSWIIAAMIITVFIVEVIIGVAYAGSPGVLIGIAGAMGLTIAGAIEAMRRLARETAQVNLVVLLARELNSEQVATIVNLLARRL